MLRRVGQVSPPAFALSVLLLALLVAGCRTAAQEEITRAGGLMRIEGLPPRVYGVSFEGQTGFGDAQLRAVMSALTRVRAQSLDVSHTSVSDSSVGTLSGLESVTHLNIAGSRMTGRAAIELAAKSPSLDAIFVDSDQAAALTVADLMSPRYSAKIILSPLEPRSEQSDAADSVEPE